MYMRGCVQYFMCVHVCVHSNYTTLSIHFMPAIKEWEDP